MTQYPSVYGWSFFSQYLTSLQLDVSQLEPSPERLPEILLEKCAAISVNPSAVDDLVSSMQCEYIKNNCDLRWLEWYWWYLFWGHNLNIFKKKLLGYTKKLHIKDIS